MKLNDAQQRLCQIFFVLAGNELHGMSNADMARALRTSESRMVSDIRNMEHAGLIERLPSVNGKPGNWRLSPRIVRIARAVDEGLSAIELQVAQIRDRYANKSTPFVPSTQTGEKNV